MGPFTGVGSAEGLSSQTLTLGGLGVGGDRRGTDGCDRETGPVFFQIKQSDCAACETDDCDREPPRCFFPN